MSARDLTSAVGAERVHDLTRDARRAAIAALARCCRATGWVRLARWAAARTTSGAAARAC